MTNVKDKASHNFKNIDFQCKRKEGDKASHNFKKIEDLYNVMNVKFLLTSNLSVPHF